MLHPLRATVATATVEIASVRRQIFSVVMEEGHFHVELSRFVRCKLSESRENSDGTGATTLVRAHETQNLVVKGAVRRESTTVPRAGLTIN